MIEKARNAIFDGYVDKTDAELMNATPPPPMAPPSAIVKTDINGNRTTLQQADKNGGYHEFSIETHVELTKDSKPGAGDPFTSYVVGVSNRHGGKNPSYGPLGAFIDVGDNVRGRELHGGGSRLADPFADYQGWVPTHGCTRGQNIDVINFGKEITTFQQTNPGTPIPYIRE